MPRPSHVVPSAVSADQPSGGLSHLDRRTSWVEVGEQSGRVLGFVRPALRSLFPPVWLEDVRLPLRPPDIGNPFRRERLWEIAASLGGFMRPYAGTRDLTEVWQFLRQAVHRGHLLVVAAPRSEWLAFTSTALIPTRAPVTTTAKVGSATESSASASAATPPPPVITPPQPTTWIEIRLVGEDDRALGQEAYRLTLGDGQVISGRFDKSGTFVRHQVDPGPCRFTLPDLDQAAWSTVSGGGAEAVAIVGGSEREHRIAEGESTSSIAPGYGFAPDTVWNDADNSELSQQRTHPNLLLPGDDLAIPARKRKELTLATNQIHVFKRHGARTLVALQLFDGDGPRANQKWNFSIGEQTSEGTSDGDGVVEFWIAPSDREVALTIGQDKLRMTLDLDRLHPVSESTGVQQRLTNLGFWWALPERSPDECLTAAVRSFQVRVGLDPSGEINDETRNKLADLHDRRCPFPAEPAIKHKA